MIKIDDRTLTTARKQKILEKFDYTCAYCYQNADQVDHVIPWAYIHDDSEENLVASCWICNLIASSKVFESFEAKQLHIITRRRKWVDGHPIPIWTKAEVAEMGYALKAKIRATAAGA